MSYIQHPGYVLRSTVPAEHISVHEANEEGRAAAVAKMEEFAASVVPDGKAWAYQVDTGSISMTGVLVPYGANVEEVPTGWRWDTKAKRGKRVLVPAKKTDEGKTLVKTMDALHHKAQSLGAVSSVVVMGSGEKRYFTSATIEVLGDDIYATYHLPVCDESHGNRPSDRADVEADPGWEPISLSVFYAAREKHAPEKLAS